MGWKTFPNKIQVTAIRAFAFFSATLLFFSYLVSMLPRFPLVLYPFVKFGAYTNSLLWIDCAFIVAIGSRMSKKELTRELVKLNLMALIVWVLMELYALLNYSGIVMFGADPNLGTLKAVYGGISTYLF